MDIQMDTNRYSWIFMDINGYSDGYQKIFMDINRYSWIFTDIS